MGLNKTVKKSKVVNEALFVLVVDNDDEKARPIMLKIKPFSVIPPNGTVIWGGSVPSVCEANFPNGSSVLYNRTGVHKLEEVMK